MDEPPAASLRGRRAQAAFRVNLAASFGTVLASYGAPGSVLLTLFLQDSLHAAKWQIGLVTTMTFLGPLLEPAGAMLAERSGRRKELFMSLFLMSRLSFFALALIPLLDRADGTHRTAIFAVLALVALTRVCHLGNPAWWSWIADLVPERRRARFFGRRAQANNAVAAVTFGLAMVLLCGCGGLENHILVSSLFAAGAAFGVADILMFFLVPEPSCTGKAKRRRNEQGTRLAPNAPFSPSLLAPFRQPSFRRLVLGMGLWLFSANLVLPFLPIFQHGEERGPCHLGLSLSWQFLALLNVGASVAAMLTSRFWARRAELLGPRRTLLLGSGYLFVNLAYLLVGPERRLNLLIPVALASGALNAAWTVSANQLLLALSPRTGRSIYVSAYNCTNGLLMAGGPLLGGLLADALPVSPRHMPGGHPLCYFHVLLGLATLGGLAALKILAGLPSAQRERLIVPNVLTRRFGVLVPLRPLSVVSRQDSAPALR